MQSTTGIGLWCELRGGAMQSREILFLAVPEKHSRYVRYVNSGHHSVSRKSATASVYRRIPEPRTPLSLECVHASQPGVEGDPVDRQPVIEPDDEYDRACASDGVSRYGAYLARYAHWFAEDGVPTAGAGTFGAAAWRIARPPVMSPGYVRIRGLLLDTHVDVTGEQGPTVCVDVLVSPGPDIATGLYPWQDCWHAPTDEADLDGLPLARIAVPLAGLPLPEPRYRHGQQPDTTTAKRAVRVLCAVLNAAAQAVLSVGPQSRSPR